MSSNQMQPEEARPISTRKAWPSEISSLADIPQTFREHFRQKGSSFPYTVYIPANTTFFKRAYEKLLCLYDGYLSVLEDTRKGIVEKEITFDKISYIESASILMVQWLKIFGPSPLTVHYHKMAESYLGKIITDIRRKICSMDKTAEHTEAEEKLLESLKTTSFKYLTTAKDMLLDEETVTNVIFQPEIKRKISQKRGKQTITEHLSSHATILTSSEIIHIREEKRKVLAKKPSYGTVTLMIPLQRVDKVELTTDRAEELKRLTVYVLDTHNLEFLYDFDNSSVDGFAKMISDCV